MLEKRALETRYPDKGDREAILEQCRKAVAQLTRLKHPQVLTVQVCGICVYFGNKIIVNSLQNTTWLNLEIEMETN